MHWTPDGKRVTDPAFEQLAEAAEKDVTQYLFHPPIDRLEGLRESPWDDIEGWSE